MAAPHFTLEENAIKPYKIKDYPQHAKGISFWAFLLSIFIYISIFYIFNLSPSTLFNTTEFWFFITNTLILIIAADFGAFFSSRKQDPYEEYVKISRARSVPSFASHYPIVVEKNIPQFETQQETIKEVAVVHKSEYPKNSLDINFKVEVQMEKPSDVRGTLEFAPKANNDESRDEEMKVGEEDDDQTRDEVKKVDKEDEEKNNKHVSWDEKRAIVQRSHSDDKHEPHVAENEFLTMSNEEVNRRVEEFIQKFNKQIRLQAAARRLKQQI